MPAKRKVASPPAGAHARKLPGWITDHFKESLNSLELLMQITDISARGIGVLRGMPKIVKVLADVEGKSDQPNSVKQLERAQKEAELASTEVEKDFPVLHGFAVVALWSWMEHFVKGFVALWLTHRRDALDVQAVQKLRVRLGEYLQLQKAEQAQFLVELLEQELASPLKRGASRFESLLQPFELSFQLPDGCGQTLFELQQVRNVIAHRNGQADRRLRSDCPWLKLKINQPVLVSRKMLHAYSEAASEFLLYFLYRVGDVYSVDLRPTEQEALNPSLPPTASGCG
ncbi:MAG: hypothetical protein Q8M93_17310 [Polaromonas sp.]|uniref:hypothetical protein n=1 Tax=Polaromonas sp. TaxID=1869339 RepID=UPI00273187F8|nr:hypothetical protein [Polaromonas sp.]MDP2448401.1 hypothetical protein [Polaromonas sp.]MDP3248706.1 hypothetical protein [Polaromonas sp.]MDP3758073.1 hypothetical protein [Polaromonas sp.]